jgi:3-isopropylmalate dehydratase small subunit
MRLLNGWDDLALTENYRERISAFKADDKIKRPWAVPPEQS